MRERLNKNQMLVKLLMQGRKFAFTEKEKKWSGIGRLAYPGKHLLVDNINIFEASWWVKERTEGAESLDDVISSLLSKLVPYHDEIMAFARKNGLVFFVDCYIEYELGYRPLTGISLENVEKLAAFECAIGWETVVKRPIHSAVT